MNHEGAPFYNSFARLVPRPVNLGEWFKYSVPVILLLNLGLSITLSLLLDVWIDEVLSLQTTDEDLSYALNRVIHLEVQPPLYVVLLYFWRKLDPSIFFARLFSVLCVSATVYVSAKLSPRFLQKVHPGWVAAVVAFNPLTIYAAVEIRMYALVLLLSALLLLFFYDGYLSETPNLRARYYYLLLSVLGLYTYYFLGFLLVANASALVLSGRWKALRSYVLGMIMVGVAFVPMLYALVGQLAEMVNNRIDKTATSTGFLEGTKFLFNRICEYVLPLDEGLAQSTSLIWLRKYFFRSAAALGLFLFVKKRFYATATQATALLGILTLLCLCFFAVRNVIGLGYLRPHHTAVLFFPAVCSVLSLASLCTNKNLFRITIGALTVYYVFTLAMTYIFVPPGKLGDSARVASYIMKNEKACEPIFFFRNEEFLTVSIYYSGPNKLVPIPNYPDSVKYDPLQKVLKDETDIVSSLSRVTCEFETFWLVTAMTKPYMGVDFHPEILENFIEKYCSVMTTKEFYHGAKVRLLRKNGEVLRTAASFSVPEKF